MALSETVMVVMTLLAVGVIVAGIIRNLPVPYTVLLVVLGMLLAAASEQVEALAFLQHFRLTPDLVFFLFLPILIFESGLTLNARQLVKDLGPVLTLAIPALLISTFLIGTGLWLLLPIRFEVAIVFGALISATDPVAVVSLFRELGTPERLTVLVEGESLLNDATAIVLFSLLLGIALHGEFSAVGAGNAILQFFIVFVGGAAVGAVAGLITSWLLRALRSPTSAAIALSVSIAFVAFILSEHMLHVSGVMACATAAVTLGILARPRLPAEAGAALNETWEFLAFVANTLLFLLVGLSISAATLFANIDLILLAVALVLIARAINIYTLVPLGTRIFHIPRISLGERHVMWWGGLKGGLALAIALSIPNALPEKSLLLSLTVGVVVFTLLVNAPTIRPLVFKLGMNRLTPHDRFELGHQLRTGRHQIQSRLGQLHSAGLISRAMLHRIKRDTDAVLDSDEAFDDVTSPPRWHWLNALRAESDALEDLYRAGLIPQYTFLDIRGELQRKRDHVVSSERLFRSERSNRFINVEELLLAKLREVNWLAPGLSRYQNVRLSRSLLKDVIRTLMAQAALRAIQKATDIDESLRNELIEHYQTRLATLHERISGIARGFPEFYRDFESHVATRAALISAIRLAEQELHHGGMGAKAFQAYESRIKAALHTMKPVPGPTQAFGPHELISTVPLFHTLSAPAVAKLVSVSETINFLAGDIVIAEGDIGDCLYVIINGELEVTQTGADGRDLLLAVLKVGDFVGEYALLEDRPRTATVKARTPSSLLRLSRHDLHSLLTDHPEVVRILEQAKKERDKTRPAP